jgi:hypothetical protein
MWGKKKGIVNEFGFYFFYPNSGNVVESNSSLCNFSFWKIEPTNKVQSFFSEKDPFSARKTSLFISFTSLIGMEWTKAFLVSMDLSTMAQFSFIF